MVIVAGVLTSSMVFTPWSLARCSLRRPECPVDHSIKSKHLCSTTCVPGAVLGHGNRAHARSLGSMLSVEASLYTGVTGRANMHSCSFALIS